jgi:TRAP transporter TAXI family solute receptor
MKGVIKVLSLAMLGILMGSGLTFSQEWKPEVPLIKLGGGSMGAVQYVLAASLANTLNKNIPGLKASVSIGDTFNNAIRVDEGTMQAGYCAGLDAYNAYNGNEPYKKAYKNIRFWFNQIGTRFNLAVRADSKIQTMTDLKDKHTVIGHKGSSSAYMAEAFLEFYGMTPESIKAAGGRLSTMALQEAANMLMDKKIDAMFCMVAPYHILKQMEATVGVRLIPMSKESIEYVIKKYPGAGINIIPKGAYAAVKEDMLALEQYTTYIVSSTLSDEEVYRMTKAVFENVKEIQSVNPAQFKDIALQRAAMGAIIPIHPGAERYYKEKGILK